MKPTRPPRKADPKKPWGYELIVPGDQRTSGKQLRIWVYNIRIPWREPNLAELMDSWIAWIEEHHPDPKKEVGKTVRCDVCAGEGTVWVETDGERETFQCPACSGSGKIRVAVGSG